MAKPTTVPTFATDTNYPAGAHGWNGTSTKTAPLAGKLAEGFEPGEFPPAQYFNWLFFWICSWIVWLNTGNVDLNNVHIAGTLLVDGISTFGANIDLAGHKILHTDWFWSAGINNSNLLSLNGGSLNHTHGQVGTILDANADAYFELAPLQWGKRLKQVLVYGIGGILARVALYRHDTIGGTYTAIACTGGIGAGSNEVAFTGTTCAVVPATIATHDGSTYVIHVIGSTATPVSLFNYDMRGDSV